MCLLLAVLAFVPFVLAVPSQPAEQYYRELDCKPMPSSEGSIERYNCEFLNQLPDNKCYFNGNQYDIGKRLSEDEMKGGCVASCFCQDSDRAKPSFTCAKIECPELFNPTPAGCTNLYEHGQCCPVGKHCDGDDPLPTCEYQGKTYKKGEKMNVENECQQCICSEGFNGTLTEPWCRNINCNMYLHYSEEIRSGCIPTYYKPTDCCPIPVWRCPSDSDAITNLEEVPTTKSQEDKCKFGNLQLGVGQKLSPSATDKCVECSCLVPPHITCVMDRECYEKKSK